MKDRKLPLRFSILKLLSNYPDGLDCRAIYEQLKGEYPKEKQCLPDTIDGHLMSMKGVGLVEVKDAVMERNKMCSTYGITAYGKERLLKYI